MSDSGTESRPYDMPAEARYHRDVEFHSLVDMLEFFVASYRFSPSELREAVVLACTNYEMRHSRSFRVPAPGESRPVP